MNTKFTLTSMVLITLVIAAACSPSRSVSSASNPAQPATRNDKAVVLVPVTGAQSSNAAQDLQTYPSQRLHRYCALQGSRKQADCVEKQPNGSTGLILFSGNSNTDVQAYPSQKLHSSCVSKDNQRQRSCMP